MRVLIMLLAILGAGFINPSVYAMASKPKTADTAVKQVILYTEPSADSKEVAKVNLWHVLVPIFKKGDWVKVGDPIDGNVGWVNMKQYRAAVSAFSKSQFKTIYIQTNDKVGKPALVVYEDGKKVSKKRAKEIYNKMQKQSQTIYKHIQAQEKQFNVQLQKMQQQMDKMMQKCPMLKTKPEANK